MPVSGSNDFKALPKAILCLLDEGLSPRISKALRLVDYDFVSIGNPPQTPSRGAEDPEVIQWCHDNKAVWFTPDWGAKDEHDALLQKTGISVVWIRQAGKSLRTRGQFSQIAQHLEQILAKLEGESNLHFEITTSNRLRVRVVDSVASA